MQALQEQWCEPGQLLHSIFDRFTHWPCSSLQDSEACLQMCNMLERSIATLEVGVLIA
jgi:hypothetical protein